jgi:hypothetical protein
MENNKNLMPGYVEQSNELLKSPPMLYQPDIDKWDQFLLTRYNLTSSTMFTSVNLLEPTGVHVDWFDEIALIDL